MNHATFFISQTQYDWLADSLPEPNHGTGRPGIPNGELLNGILFVVKTGCRWMDIPTSVCDHDYSSCWRRLRFWQKYGHLKLTWQRILVLLDREQKIDLSIGNLDGSLVQSPQYAGVGYDSQHKRYGTNISLLTEKNGLPLCNMTFRGNRNDIVCAETTMNKLRVGAKRRVLELNADKGYDSMAFRRKMRLRGTMTNIPERKSKHRRKRGRKPHMSKAQFKFRAFTERTNAWLKYYRKLRYRWERKRGMFQAIVDFCCLLICLRRVGVLQ
jgi:transposase